MSSSASRSPQHDTAQEGGFLVSCPPRVQHHTRVRMLSSKVRAKRKTWLIAAEQPVELLFFRAIFSELLRREIGISGEAVGDDHKISLEAFQIAMERLFFALNNYDGFDARSYDSNEDGGVSWPEFFRVYREKELTIRLSLLERIYLTFEHPDASYLSQVISNLILLTIIASSLSFILGTMPDCKMKTAEWCDPLKGVELFCLVLFIIEYAMRLCTCWAVRPVVGDQAKLLELVVGFEAISQGHPLMRMFTFVTAPSNLVDAAAILPGLASRVTQAEGGAFVILRLIRLTRILRAFKSPALAEAVRVISMTMQQSTQALYILAFNLMLGVVIFGSLMYMAEGGPELNAFDLGGRWSESLQAFERPADWNWDGKQWVAVWERSDFQSIPEACWWAMVTVTTVGYGDKFPTTMLGKIVGVWTMLFSLVILALPVGVIGGTFSDVWRACDMEKKAQEQALQLDLKVVAHELSRLEPIVMSKLMLVEVWHDEAPTHDNAVRGGERPPPSAFMGEAKLQLDIGPDAPCSRVCTVALSPNSEIAKRGVSGKITLQYDWTPDARSKDSLGEAACSSRRVSRISGDVMPMEPIATAHTKLRGKLRVTVVSGDGLINLNTHRRGCSSPYCMVLCYPKRNEEVGLPEPCIWRTPTVKESLSPSWGVSHTFDFWWSAKGELSRKQNWEQPLPYSPVHSPRGGPASPADDVLALARDLGEQLQQHRADARAVRSEVHRLMRDVTEHLGVAPAAAPQALDAGRLFDVARLGLHETGQASSSASSTVAGNTPANVGLAGSAAPRGHTHVLLPHCVPPKTLC